MAKQPRQRATPEEARAAYERARQSIISRVKDPKKQKKALLAYDSDPRIQTIRGLAGMPFVSTRLQDRKKAAPNLTPEKRQEAVRRTIEQQKEANRNSIIPESVRDYGAGLLGSANDMFLGLPAFAAAQITGTDNDLMQEYARQQGQRAPITNFLGTLAGSVFTGGGLLRGGAALAGGLARSGTPALARTGQVLQSGGKAMTLKKGENLKNAGRLAAGGATYGATESAIKGEDIAEGAAFGAGGSVALGAGLKFAGFLGGKASEALRVSGADAMLRRNLNLTKEQLQKRYDDFRARTGGGNPTVYELLDAEERNAVSEIIGRLKPQSLERASALARERVNAVPREVAQVVRNATRDQRKSNIKNLVSAQAASRDVDMPTISEARLAVGAADNPTRLAQIRRDEAKNIMGPFDERKAVDSVDELVPTEPRAGSKPGQIVEEETADEISKTIRLAAGPGRLRSSERGLSVGEVTGMISTLKEEAANSSKDLIDRTVAKEAAEHLESVLVSKHPDMAPALARMNAAWAARSRQLEGMGEIRLQADFDVRRPKGLSESEKIFETPEGAVGRQAGQRAELLDDLGRRPDVALGTARNLADDITEQRRIAQNIGKPAQREISQAAKEQVESVRKLSNLVKDSDFKATDLTGGDLTVLTAALNSGAMAITQARGLMTAARKLVEAIPESNRRAVIVDMLLSRDPALAQRAINVLRSQGGKGDAALRDFILTVVGGAQGRNLLSYEEPEAPMPADTEIETPEAVTGDEYAEFADEDGFDEYAEFAEVDPENMTNENDTGDASGQYAADNPYTTELSALYANESPALLDLIERVSGQESRKRQFNSDGSVVTSKAGAIGIMQVMPGTGPEAARLAGVPWDPKAYRNDEAYNKLIGAAYLSEMLRRYEGDVELALIGYNAGPGRADDYKAGRISFAQLPKETREYVQKLR